MTNPQLIRLTETPRDAMQGWPRPVPAIIKAKYINALLKVGFDTVDFGSFVSPKAIPQMADTAEVLELLDISSTRAKLMVIAGNSRGALSAASMSKIHTIAYPYSVSGTFLRRNLNTNPENAWKTMLDMKQICDNSGKEMRVYLAMAFGNPYGDECNDELVTREVEKLRQAGIQDLVFSDITGEGTPETIGRLSSVLLAEFPDLQPGIHLHTRPGDWQAKMEAAWSAGVRRFESALGGYGGCPMSGYELLANMDTLHLVEWFARMEIPSGLDLEALNKAQLILPEVFNSFS